jgi:hypothetical protein
MSTVVTSDRINRSETTEGHQNGPDSWQNSTGRSLNPLRASLPCTAIGEGIIGDETGRSQTDECTYETDETDEPEEAQEREEAEGTKELEEREEIDSLGPKLFCRINDAISECRVSGGDINRPLFMLAHKVRSIEEELNVRFSINATVEIVKRWQASNQDHLENDHDYPAEFLDKLWLVRFPKGRALATAVEIARNIAPPKQTELLSADVQLLAKLCCVLQDQAGNKPFFFDGRSAAKALGIPHRTVASWLRALCWLGVIIPVSQGRRGRASRYLYLATPLKH